MTNCLKMMMNMMMTIDDENYKTMMNMMMKIMTNICFVIH